jgi:hypothetical protein
VPTATRARPNLQNKGGDGPLSPNSPSLSVYGLQAELLKFTLSAGAYVFEVWRDTKFDWHQRLRNEIAEATTGFRACRFALPAVVYLVENHVRFLVLKMGL